MESKSQDKIQNLQEQEAVDKLKSLVKSAKVCMFQTQPGLEPFNLRPMSPVETDESGQIWFFSSRKSDKNREISVNPRVQLIFSNMQDSEFLSVYGHASIVVDKQKFRELWNPMVEVWFTQGVEDPDLTLISVKPLSAHYWDTRDSKMVTLFKMAVAIVSGRPMDDGIEGDLRI